MEKVKVIAFEAGQGNRAVVQGMPVYGWEIGTVVHIADGSFDACKAQRDQLLAALEEARQHVVISPDPVRGGLIADIDAAIAAARGGDA